MAQTIEQAAELDLDLLGASRQGDIKTLNELFAKGGNAMAMDRNGTTPLHFGSTAGHEAVVQLLLNTNQIDVNVKNTYGMTPIWEAFYGNHEAVVRQLLHTRQVDVNVKGLCGDTLLLFAIRKGHEALVRLVLNTSQVDVNVKDN